MVATTFRILFGKECHAEVEITTYRFPYDCQAPGAYTDDIMASDVESGGSDMALDRQMTQRRARAGLLARPPPNARPLMRSERPRRMYLGLNGKGTSQE